MYDPPQSGAIASISRPILAPRLVGRGAQATALRHALETAHGGDGRCVMLTGEAGIGKSRLLAEAKERAAQLGLPILQGNCFEPDRALPFAPLIDLLRAWYTGQPADRIAWAFGASATQLVGLLPDLARLLPKLTPAPAVSEGAAQEQRRLFNALADMLLRIGSPALIILEDLHWCDDTTLDFLHTFVPRIAGHPILLLLTYRSDDVGDRLRHLLAVLDRARKMVDEIALDRLSGDQVREMIAAIFEQRWPVRGEFVEAIHALTDGNPFFIEETLKALVASGDIFFEGGIWTRKPMHELRIPRSVEDAVESRVRQLTPDAQHLLRLAAVMGRRFDFDVLCEVAGRSEVEVLLAVKALIAAQLVVEESADQFAFRHALTRQAIYASMLARERRPLHQMIAEAIERRSAHQLDTHAADLAEHYFAAGSWAQALLYAQRAGERAQALFASRAAVEQYTRAIQAAEQLGTPMPAALYQSRGQAHELLGAFEAARADYEHACALAGQAGDLQAEWRGLMALGFLWTGYDYSKAGEYLQRASAAARAIDEPSTLAQTLNRLGNWHLMTEEPRRSIDCHQEALVIFQAIGDRHGMAATLDLLGISHCMHGDMATGARHYEQAIELWRALGERQWLINSLASFSTRGGNYLFATARCQPVALEQCIHEAEEALALARQIGWPNGEATALIWLGHALGPRGEWARALAAAQSALDLSRNLEHPLWILTAHAIFGAAYLDMGAFARAQQEFTQALEMARSMGTAYVIHSMAGYLASALIGQRQLEQAAATLDAVSDTTLPIHSQAQHHIWRARAELALARGNPAAALGIADRLIASLGAPAEISAIVSSVPRLWLLRGTALASLGRAAESELALSSACDAADALGAHPLRWRTHAALADLYRSKRRREAADRALNMAHTIIEALAANAPDDELRTIFTRYAHTVLPSRSEATPRQAAKQQFGGLTERERQIAALVAQGKTTRAIAGELTLSERTIEKHIANIMAKLGVDTRTQIGVWAAEHRLTHA